MTNYRKGLHDLGSGSWAYLQPDGSWGFSNAGLVTDGEASLLVDTLFDLKLTAEMLDRMRDASPAARHIDTVVNTHANGDHTYGNQLVGDAVIVAARGTADEMREVTPALMARFKANAASLGAAGEFFARVFGPFEWEGIELTLPTETFEGEHWLRVGDKDVHLIDVGPAHTRADTLVHVPSDRVVYTGDILFIDGTPIVWEGPIQNWIDACDRICAMDAEAIVPGHGPVTDEAGVRAVRDYLVYIEAEARKRFEAGLSVRDAAFDIALGDFASWGDAERIGVNVHTLYREFGAGDAGSGPLDLFGLMAELAGRR